MKKKRALSDEGTAKQAAETTAEFLTVIIHMIRRDVEIAADAKIATGAFLKAAAEQFPQLVASYERHYAEDSKTSELSAQTRQIVAELDRLISQAKYGS